MTAPRKKILLVTSGFPYGNTERGFLTTEFAHLQEAFDVSVLSIGSFEELLYPFPPSIPLERYHYPPLAEHPGKLLLALLRPQVLRELICAVKGQPLSRIPARFKQVLAYWCNAQSIARRMESYILNGKAGLIYTYWCTEATLAGCLLKEKYPELKLVTRFHGHDLFHERRSTCYQPFRHLIGGQADKLIFACMAGRNYFLSHWGQELQDKSLLCYLGSAPAKLPPKAPCATLRLVSCSNLIPLKRVDAIISGISQLPRQMPIRWDHFGDGPDREKLEALAASSFGPNVTWKFHGHVPNNTIPQEYEALDPDLFLTTSSTEGGVPVSIQEAFSMGIPAIGTDVGGIPDLVITGQTGYLIPEQDCAKKLRDAIVSYAASSREEKQALSRGALALWQEKFDAQRNSAELMQLLHQLLE